MSNIVRSIRKYPVKSEVVRKELVPNSGCPECGGALGPAWECIERRCRLNGKPIIATLLTLKDS